jgi:hypothetical protein
MKAPPSSRVIACAADFQFGKSPRTRRNPHKPSSRENQSAAVVARRAEVDRFFNAVL